MYSRVMQLNDGSSHSVMDIDGAVSLINDRIGDELGEYIQDYVREIEQDYRANEEYTQDLIRENESAYDHATAYLSEIKERMEMIMDELNEQRLTAKRKDSIFKLAKETWNICHNER